MPTHEAPELQAHLAPMPHQQLDPAWHVAFPRKTVHEDPERHVATAWALSTVQVVPAWQVQEEVQLSWAFTGGARMTQRRGKARWEGICVPQGLQAL